MGNPAPIVDLELLRQQIERLQRPGAEPRSVDESFSRLKAALEELHVAGEELRVQNGELMRALGELDVERDRYQRLCDMLPDAYLVVDGRGVVLEANARAAGVLGRPVALLIGEQVSAVIGEGAADGVRSVSSGRVRTVLADIGGGLAEIRVEPYRVPGGAATAWLIRDRGSFDHEGEDFATADAAVARSWLAVYSELISISETAAETMERSEDRESVAGRRVEVDRRAVETRLSHLRRRRALWRDRHAELAGMELDRASGILRVGLAEVRLTRREAQLLAFLLQHPGTAFTAETLVNRAWLASFLSQEQLRTYVGRLRLALQKSGAPCRLVNRRGRGYALVFD